MPDEDVQSLVQTRLVGWRYVDQHLEKTYRTHQWRATLMAVNAIAHLSEQAWHHPELVMNYSTVVVRLTSHDVGRVTLRDIELAERIDDCLLWQPDREAGRQHGGLTGLPDNERCAYIQAEPNE